MAESRIHTYLIAYDISDPRRLQRVHKFLKQCAVPIQYSVFITRISEAQLARIKVGIVERICDDEDDVRIYHIPDRTEVRLLGRSPLPEGMQLVVGDGAATMKQLTASPSSSSVEQLQEELEPSED
ncbi:MAG: CRISPR-associated endonuclease Cas2 [Betaproteobacteria bacterium]|nr:CRISPR-associated endonuclease Cas2 [Candidatus Methylomirabilis sp.]NJD34640.1 CRISPR-associated endonuclease Cas2 [Betaproteobacteria bacterium]